MIEWISVKDKLPENNQRVLIWNGGVDVATFKHGISIEEREQMKNGELPDPEDLYWCGTMGYVKHKRSSIHKAYDEWANNLLPYGWDVGFSVLFGQNVNYWADINCPKQLEVK